MVQTFATRHETVTEVSCSLSQSMMTSYHQNALGSLEGRNIRPCFALFLLQEVNKPPMESPFPSKNLLQFRLDLNLLSQLSC